MNWLGKLATEAENFLEQTENVGQNVAEKINNSNESVESTEPTQSKEENAEISQDETTNIEKEEEDEEEVPDDNIITMSDSNSEDEILKPEANTPTSPINHNHKLEIELLKSELAAMEEQNTGLKALWNETRTEKKKAVDKLLKIEKITKQKLKENNLQWEEQLQEMETSYQGQTRSLKKSHLEEIRNFEVALKAKNEANQLFMEELKEAQAKSENQGGETEILNKEIEGLEEERDDLIKQHAIISEEHTRRLQTLRQDFIERERQIQEETEVKLANHSTIQNRQHEIENHSIESTNAYAKAQQQVLSKEREVQRLANENRFLLSDKSALQEQIGALKQVDNLTKQEVEEYKKKLDEQRDNVLKARQEKQAETLKLRNKIQELSSRLKLQPPQEDTTRIENLEKRLSTMTSHLLERQNQLEKVKHQKSQYENLLQETREQNKYLRNQMQKLEIEGDVELGNYTNAKTKRRLMRTEGPTGSPTLNVAINVMDNLGAQLTVLLRRHMIVRTGFIMYILLLHIWVMVVLYSWHQLLPVS